MWAPASSGYSFCIRVTNYSKIYSRTQILRVLLSRTLSVLLQRALLCREDSPEQNKQEELQKVHEHWGKEKKKILDPLTNFKHAFKQSSKNSY